MLTSRISARRSVAVAVLVLAAPLSAQTTIRLSSPGSVNSPLPEESVAAERFNRSFASYGEWLFNVSEPSLTVYRPNRTKANGSAIIVCPGGGFHFLAMGTEGAPMAEWLRRLGITVFILKYRVIPTTAEHRAAMFAEGPNSHSARELPSILPLEMADGRAALNYVRAHAVEYGIAPTRIGMLGASAGAVLAFSLVVDSSSGAKPDFLALMYTGIFES